MTKSTALPKSTSLEGFFTIKILCNQAYRIDKCMNLFLLTHDLQTQHRQIFEYFALARQQKTQMQAQFSFSSLSKGNLYVLIRIDIFIRPFSKTFQSITILTKYSQQKSPIQLNLKFQLYKIKTMELIQSNTLSSHTNFNSHIETPTKKFKKQSDADFNTADSIVLTDQKSSINDIDPQELFDRFHDIIKISEEEDKDQDEQNAPSVYRMLDYQNNPKKAIKLNFSPENSSMSKRNKIQTGKCLNNPIKGRHLFEMMPVMSPIKRKSVLQNEAQQLMSQSKADHTPTKMNKLNSHCEMAAKKESPYRDLTNRN